MNAAEHLRALTLLAEALRGAPVPLKITNHHPARPALVPARHGGRTETVIALPAAAQGYTQAQDWRAALRLSVLRACLIEAAKTPAAQPASFARRDRRPRLERWLEQLLQRVWVDRRIAAGYPGAKADLQSLIELTRIRLGPAPQGALRALLHALVTRSMASAPFSPVGPTHSKHDALLESLCQQARRVLEPQSDLQACASIASAMHALLQPHFPGSRRTLRSLVMPVLPAALTPREAAATAALGQSVRPDEDDTQAADAPAQGAQEPAALSAAGSIGDARIGQHPMRGSVGTTRSQAMAPGAQDGENGDDAEEATEVSIDLDPVHLRGRYGLGAGDAVGVYLIDEWDCHARKTLPAWCRLHELRLRGPDQDFLSDVRKRHPELARRILERFTALKPVSHRRVRGVADGDDLDPDGVITAMIERRSGSASDQRAWVRRERRDRDVATALLLDMSASTSLSLPAPVETPPSPRPAPDATATQGALLYGFYDDPLAADPGPPRRRVIDVARDSMALMALGLAALGDDHAIYGFSGSGRDHVEFHVARDFDDPWRQRALGAALAAIEPRGSTRMGPAIRHAAAKLARRPAPQRLLILVSDGYPQDIDYGPDRNDEGYGLQDTARALREAERQGVATFCVTIDPGGHDYLRRMCTPEGYRVIDDVHALPEALSEIYARLTGRV